VVFRRAATLRRLYPRLVHHGLTALGSTDVLRFLGRRIPASGEVPKHFQGEVLSELKQREEGVRIKHTVNGNSVKLYDKAFTAVGSVLRAEATLQNTDDLRVYRPREGIRKGCWLGGGCDAGLPICIAERRFRSKPQSATWMPWPKSMRTRPWRNWLGVWAAPEVEGTQRAGFAPLGRGSSLVAAVSEGSLPSRDSATATCKEFSSPKHLPTSKKPAGAGLGGASAALAAGHGLIRKISGTHRYQLTPGGRKAITALLTALHATVRQLTPIAA